MFSFLNKTAALATLVAVAPGLAFAVDRPSPEYSSMSKSQRDMSEGLAFRIAESLYRIDYLNPELDGAVIDDVITPILEDAQPTPDMRRYIGEILDVWFVSQPRIVESVARVIPEHAERLDVAKLDNQQSPIDATQGIPSTTEILRLAPPVVVSRGSSDY